MSNIRVNITLKKRLGSHKHSIFFHFGRKIIVKARHTCLYYCVLLFLGLSSERHKNVFVSIISGLWSAIYGSWRSLGAAPSSRQPGSGKLVQEKVTHDHSSNICVTFLFQSLSEE